MLSRYRPGERVNPADGEDLDALLDEHPDSLRKRAVGVSHFEVMMSAEGTPCFRVVRTDGTGEDFSFYSCINKP